MKKKEIKIIGIILLIMVNWLFIIGCDDESTINLNNNPKTIIINDINSELYDNIRYGGFIGIYPTGTTRNSAFNLYEIVAGNNFTNTIDNNKVINEDIIIFGADGADQYTMAIPLYNIVGDRWLGQGSFDFYIFLNNDEGYNYGIKYIYISSDITNISRSYFQKYFPTSFYGEWRRESDFYNYNDTRRITEDKYIISYDSKNHEMILDVDINYFADTYWFKEEYYDLYNNSYQRIYHDIKLNNEKLIIKYCYCEFDCNGTWVMISRTSM